MTPTPATTPTLKLPNARHAARAPAHITPEQLERVRQAAYNLPQVVKPADYWPEDAPELEKQLDTQGLILLQKAVPHQRPSRWISPQLLDAALLHLAEVGVGRDVRTLMVERLATLEALGITREPDALAGGWERLHSQPLTLSSEDWPQAGLISVAFRAPVVAEPVWAFFRNGDKRALLAALGGAPAYPHATELAAHLDALAERSAFKPNASARSRWRL